MTFAYMLGGIALTAFCWGVYGTVLHKGVAGMQGSQLRPYVCVGLAYFVIAIIVPSIVLQTAGEAGRWSTIGVIWSCAAGTCGALGALGIIIAFKFEGHPIFVMPLVFGGAPVINAVVSAYTIGKLRDINPVFIAGLIMVVTGAVIVLVTKPKPDRPHAHSQPSVQQKASTDAPKPAVNDA